MENLNRLKVNNSQWCMIVGGQTRAQVSAIINHHHLTCPVSRGLKPSELTSHRNTVPLTNTFLICINFLLNFLRIFFFHNDLPHHFSNTSLNVFLYSVVAPKPVLLHVISILSLQIDAHDLSCNCQKLGPKFINLTFFTARELIITFCDTVFQSWTFFICDLRIESSQLYRCK